MASGSVGRGVVGRMVGASDGEMEGEVVGCEVVGENVGVLDGEEVVGSMVGTEDGDRLGTEVSPPSAAAAKVPNKYSSTIGSRAALCSKSYALVASFPQCRVIRLGGPG